MLSRSVSHQSAHQASHNTAHLQRVTPTTAINAQYAAFVADFVEVEQAYVDSLSSGSTNTITVTATLTAPYVAGAVQMQVDNASVFGPTGTFTTPVNATASFGGIPVGSFVLTGRSGNTLTSSSETESGQPESGRDPISQCPEHQPNQCLGHLSHLHHQSHPADGHQSGQLLQRPSAQASRVQCTAAYTDSARSDPEVRVRPGGRFQLHEPAAVLAAHPPTGNCRAGLDDLQCRGGRGSRTIASADSGWTEPDLRGTAPHLGTCAGK